MKKRIFNLLFKASVWAALFFCGLLISGSAQGEIIPADRRTTWQGNVGIPGGLTNRSIIYANVKNAPYNAKGDGVTDDTAAIQAALNACPAEQVVYIPAGTYNVTTLYMKGPYTLRGAGPASTMLNGKASSDSAGAAPVIRMGGAGDQNWACYMGQGGDVSPATSIIAGATNYSSTLIVSSASGMSVGKYLYLDCLDDGGTTWTPSALVNKCGNQSGSCTRASGRWLPDKSATVDNSRRNRCEIVQIIRVSGTTITIDPPLPMDMPLSPAASAFSIPATGNGNQYAGIENLKIVQNNNGASCAISMWRCAYCWVKGIEISYPDGDYLNSSSSFRCEIRDSYFHDGWLHGPGSTDDCLRLTQGTSFYLIENNIIRRSHVGMMFDFAGGGHVVAYNYITNNFDVNCLTCTFASVDYHGTHVPMILWEGNVGIMLNQDGGWGSGSHGTLLRNFLTGNNYCNPPFTGNGPETGPVTHQIQYNWCINLANNSKYFNVVGNVLGVPEILNINGYSCVYTNVWPSTIPRSQVPQIMSLGYGEDTNGSDPMDNTYPYTTLINHGNWDIVNHAQVWSTNTDHTIPQSYYLASKPAFFGSMTWPPVEPSTWNPNSSAPLLPAEYRYIYGTNPPAGLINQRPIANVSATQTNGPAPLAVSFSSAGSYDPEGVALSYAWTFGDGTTSTAANPSHTYQNPGSYSAQLRVSDGTSTTTSSLITINLTIAGTNQPPVAVASAAPTAAPAPLSVTFSSAGSYDPEGAALTYNWTFGDGSTSTAANPSHSYAAGTFSAQLRVSDGTNSTSSNPMTITVTNPAPTVLLNSPTNGASYTAPATINLAASVTPNGHTITKVQFYNGTALLGEDTAAPYTLSLTNVGAATYSLVAQAVYDAGATTASSAVTVTVGGLVAAYGFDEGSGSITADGSANGNKGTVSNATWTTDGRDGDALVFGTNALVTVNDSASLDLTTGITLEAWVYPVAVGGWRPVIFKPLGSSGLCYVLQGSSASGSVPSFGLSVSSANVMAPSPLLLNTWSHLAATYDGATMRLYINGNEVANQAQTGAVATSTDPLTIGGNSSGENFAGTIDEVRIYSRALSPSEIQSDMNTPVVSPPPPPTGLHVVGGG